MGEMRAVSSIEALHGVHDDAKRDRLASGMGAHGWTGRPILAYDDGNGLHALTGSHREAAAKQAGVEIPVYVIDITAHVWDDDEACVLCGEDCWTIAAVEARDDDDRLAAIERSGDTTAIDLMRAEVAACEAE